MFDNDVLSAMAAFSFLDSGENVESIKGVPSFLLGLYLGKAQSLSQRPELQGWSKEGIAMALIKKHMEDLVEEIQEFLAGIEHGPELPALERTK